VVTEGVFTRMILDDPGLDGVAAVMFDEFHERSLDADLGLALARDAQTAGARGPAILVMSATLDGARISALLGDAPIVESQGRMFPVDTRYLGRDERQRLEERVAAPSSGPWPRRAGSLLVFLPGQGEIRRAETLLRTSACAGPRSMSRRCTARSIPPNRTGPSARAAPAGARWCWPPRSPRPA
jgi:ATP-dependent helicase HrpB